MVTKTRRKIETALSDRFTRAGEIPSQFFPLTLINHLLSRYYVNRTYRWNYDHAPDPVDVDVPDWPGDWSFCGLKVDSPMGISAGPLLNGKWCRYYANLGFDILTYKTVRSGVRECYPLPNLLPVDCDSLQSSDRQLNESPTMAGSWAVSFGMPSASPETWRRDVEATRKALPAGKVLCVSVVGTVQPGWGMEELAEDYALCSRWAVESGADAIETNFSCPNVSTCDGQLFQDPVGSRLVAQTVREAIGDVPLIIKIGYTTDEDEISDLLDATGDHASALAMTNSIAATVVDRDQRLLFDGQKRGICGTAIHQASVQQVRRFERLQANRSTALRWIGVGGIDSFQAIQDYLDAGAETCQLATAIMTDPEVGLRIRRDAALAY